MTGTRMRWLLLCAGLALFAPAVLARDECQEEEGDWNDEADAEGQHIPILR